MEQQEDKRLFLLDALALIYRAYYAFIKRPLYNSKGINTSAIQGFTNTLLDLLNNEKPTHIAVVFDTHAPTQRAEEFDFYKANRQEMPEDIVRSIPYIKKILEGFKIPVLELDGYEADDIIGTLAKKTEQLGYDVYMVTPDKDFGQLVSDHIFMYRPPHQGNRKFEKLGVPEIRAKWDIKNVDQVIDILGLMGDAVDNIPGVPGVGEKTAIKLLKEFGSIENLLESTDKLKGKLKEKIEENKDKAIISKQLATIDTDVPIDWSEKDLNRDEPDKTMLSELFNELEFRALGKKIIGDDFKVASTAPSGNQMDLFGNVDPVNSSAENGSGVANNEGRNIYNTPHHYKIVQTLDDLNELMEELKKADEFCFDTETTSLVTMEAKLVGISISTKPHEAYFVPVPEDYNETKKIIDQFASYFESDKKLKIAQNIKYDLMVLSNYGLKILPPFYDTMLAHYLLEPDLRHNMDFMAETYLGYHPVSIETLIGKKGKNQRSIRESPLEKLAEYAGEDADVTLQLKHYFSPLVKEQGLEKLLEEIELPLVPVLAEMEFNGIKIDIPFLSKYSEELSETILELTNSIFSYAGGEFNIDSPKQLGDILFRHLQIPYSGPKTKTGQFKTNEETLRKLRNDYEIIQRVMEYRELVKLKSTYVNALPKMVNERTGRIHTTYNQAVANTGRLSSANPNLQNIPIRTERGRKVREAFVPRSEKYTLLSADYSQIELRIIASMSKDENMMEAFKNGEDIHKATAARIFGIKPEEVTREMRSKAKAVNFGIIYGQTAFGLSQNLGISRKEAAGIIESYFIKFPGIKAYMEKNKEFARKHGYAKTLLNRKRHLKDINSANQTVRGFAERNAINMPIQGTAADMIKIAMIDVYNEINNREMRSKLILQVHDELVFDAYKPELETLEEIVKTKMANALPLEVPVVVETGTGDNWLKAH
jgi:DNA polymerase I